MRAAIVKASTIFKYRRMDPSFYLVDLSLTEAVRKAEAGLKQAQERLREAERAERENREKVAAMEAAGEVVRVAGDGNG
jgi:hypothetical protein